MGGGDPVTQLYLSRVKLRDDPSVAALAHALMPRNETNANTDHRAIWSLFSEADASRDFLWRKEGDAPRYLVLSQRAPDVASPIFHVETRSFDPDLQAGDTLAFHLRVNATVSRKTGPGRGKRHDVAMDLLHPHPQGERAEHRDRLAEQAARDWLMARAEGFELTALMLERYETIQIPRKGKPARFGVFDLAGQLRVTDPAAFLARLARGFGRARAFGCGLMLIRRA
jgi:CRISPR system Cascade subunit CasE